MDWKGSEELKEYADQRQREYDMILTERKRSLERLGDDIRSKLKNGSPARIVFICTHNSRRSHMGHLWAQLGAAYHGVNQVNCFSGGTETTAFHPHAVEALRGAGFRIRNNIPGANPIYKIKIPGSGIEQKVFSKKYTDPPNPTRDFIAVMTCSDADEACPVVFGASARHSIRYEDPKVYDGTPDQQEGYAERCRQISREMLYLFASVSQGK